jgi:hypothetical protein
MIRWLIPLLLMVGAASTQTAVPDPTITPGAVRTTDAADVCSHGTNQLRHMSRNQPRPSCELSEARSELVPDHFANIGEKLGHRLDARDDQSVAGPGAGDVKQMPLGVIDLL